MWRYCAPILEECFHFQTELLCFLPHKWTQPWVVRVDRPALSLHPVSLTTKAPSSSHRYCQFSLPLRNCSSDTYRLAVWWASVCLIWDAVDDKVHCVIACTVSVHGLLTRCWFIVNVKCTCIELFKFAQCNKWDTLHWYVNCNSSYETC